MREPPTELATRPIRVLVADDQALLRGSFRVLIESSPGFVVTGEAATGADAVALAARDQPDVILMDVRMPEMDGIEATRRICAAPGPRVLILTMFDLDPYVYAALRAGASGFLLKDTPPQDLLTAIRVVAAGQALFAPTVIRRLVETLTATSAAARRGRTGRDRTAQNPSGREPTGRDPTAGNPTGRGLAGILTGREREILTLVAHGLSNAEIAERGHISQATVKSHLGHLLAKLAARDRAQLVIAAYEAGLVTPSAATASTSRPPGSPSSG